ncbi:Excinuclease ABC subunit B (UvrB) [Prochlorococcus marinus subsp. pastoris str. CCMP1986]|jgi:excinuclease ABC subunit B|uniref:UvrABC system protein B n=1 Tax=Prochlorococcus marinus subsp. pastoris (strain CCMP1986 / NIES-2087 / MED4) TaxID=59919 RepID=UVRB_PROMP|nr:excinuclease ABC subunit UvrB [Prochlorococcus marinus]Q7UZL3.1 RecName: Full=UvrABC system protein B; Short=Protein UvrB; AltName: Full=Excinuclease ABC subunit B [Prochlorococcus marinus subsp. pastoris str. CCMP1986]MDC3072401.1 excinuclease ABC subunit UvrB [Prochlorococcus sp. AH-716-O10]MDC3182784.1 excinuclease ABC subunit UvrB [Prochlorococcus sp. AH-716-B23]RCL50748.1 MAG: excinuclease ABC subunit UvrB [Prochlorococcus sp. MED-G72]KGF86896.1 Excinuclease ABC subunit B [Prochlorococ|tara:strand:+ start:1759 stop:3798 length:2040 start_codon:yes stop_codon:yes gene_type:complete
MNNYKLQAPYQPNGDQPKAIKKLVQGVNSGEEFQTLLGATGTGKTFTIANVIQQTGRPALILAHNKTLAAQLCNELRQFFPKNAVEYFISYYDYYQPEAYVPVSDTYIAKTASINEEIDMLRHSATRSLFERKDVIVVASISCIYGLGIPSEYLKAAVKFAVGESIDLRSSLRALVDNQYTRNDTEITRGRFRIKGDVLEIGPAYEDRLIRIELFGDEIEAIRFVDPLTGEILESLDQVSVYPAKHFVTPKERLDSAISAIRNELKEQLDKFAYEGKLLEAQRLEQRTKYDLEMLREVGYCNGVENYARHLAGREEGTPPECLIDYFPKDWLLVVDESHVTCPQLHAMYNGDQARKKVLIDHGFRLPSAADNRPLKCEEFWEKSRQTLFISATPGQWELDQCEGKFIEQVIRPTGVLDPIIDVRPSDGQIDDLLSEIRVRAKKNQRVLVTTLTKRMAEDLTDFLSDNKVRVRYLHSEIHSIERIEIIQDLRLGEYDVLVGVNLLREGLDLPEVSLVAILDADKEGFLRAERSLIQTIGRAARHVEGVALLYADNFTESMKRAISETDRRRTIQKKYNQINGITPKPAGKKIENSILSFLELSRKLDTGGLSKDLINIVSNKTDDILNAKDNQCLLDEMPSLIDKLENKMKDAAKELNFEEAANLRDRIKKLRQKLSRNT